MLTNIKIGEYEEITSHSHDFHYQDTPGAGFSFKVDSAGNMINTNEAAVENYRAALAGEIEGLVDDGFRTRTHHYRHPTTGTCRCGRKVYLHGDTTCDCGRIYNSGGQELLPRHMWEEPWDEE